MTDCKPEVYSISRMEGYIAEISTALPTYSIMPEPMVILPTLCDVSGLLKFKMADYALEVLYISLME
jgi:hypothetical protein